VWQSYRMPSPGPLVVLRHGESEWNASGLFTGWVDVGLSASGEAEAVHAGRLLVQAGLLPDVVHTSVLRRAIRTAELALEAAERSWIPVRRSMPPPILPPSGISGTRTSRPTPCLPPSA
jgi:2,3-bisphosphoglycerate-dependent phosphoglycerate mutase